MNPSQQLPAGDRDGRRCDEVALRQQQDSPGYFEDPQKDHMLRLILELAEEICVQRDRVETATLLSRAGQPVTGEAIDDFEVSEELTEQRLESHQQLYEELFRKLSS